MIIWTVHANLFLSFMKKTPCAAENKGLRILQCRQIIMSPHHGGEGHIVFSADPVGVGVATCLQSISIFNGRFAKLT